MATNDEEIKCGDYNCRFVELELLRDEKAIKIACKEIESNSAYYKRLVINSFKAINYLYVTSFTTSAAIVAARILGYKSVKVGGTEIPLSYSIAIFVLFTIVHLFFADQKTINFCS